MGMTETYSTQPPQDWRPSHLGRLLGHAMRRFDTRVRLLMAQHIDVPLALSNLAARDKVSAAHIHLTRHLPLAGADGYGHWRRALPAAAPHPQEQALAVLDPDGNLAGIARADGAGWLQPRLVFDAAG